MEGEFLPKARSKQCLIGPAITKLSAGDLGAGYAFKQKIVKSTKTVKGILFRRHKQNTRCTDEAWSISSHNPHYYRH